MLLRLTSGQYLNIDQKSKVKDTDDKDDGFSVPDTHVNFRMCLGLLTFGLYSSTAQARDSTAKSVPLSSFDFGLLVYFKIHRRLRRISQ